MASGECRTRLEAVADEQSGLLIIPPGSERSLDIQWLAFKAGLKLAMRVSCDPSSADAIERRYRAGGAQVRRGLRVIDGERQAVVYVAQTAARAEELRNLDCGTTPIAWVRNFFVGHDRELGTLLGYPACCVQAFQRRARPRLDDWYRTAQNAWMARPAPRLNVLLMPEGRSLLSFYPCRYDCEAALELADRIADIAREADAAWLDFVEHQLALPIAVDRTGARAHVELDGPIRDGKARVVRAWAPVDARGNSLLQDRELAGRLAGRPVSALGRVSSGARGPEPLVIDFSAGR